MNPVITKPLSFAEKESICERAFNSSAPFWHLFTDGTQMQDIFITEEDFDLGMVALAVACCMFKDVKILTFELMANHLHVISSCTRQDCLKFFDVFKDRLRRIFRKRNRPFDWSRFQADILQVRDLKALRNEIIYVNRNAFVANTRHTPYGYPWGGGCAYFNPMIHRLNITRIDDLTFDKRRELAHSRDVRSLKGLAFDGDRVHIPSFCYISLGESMFADARSYFNSLTRNAEAFSEIASRLKDSVFMTDDELFHVAVKEAGQRYDVRQLTLLAPDQKISLAKELHFRYNASNQQLRRILRLDIAVLDKLFPPAR